MLIDDSISVTFESVKILRYDLDPIDDDVGIWILEAEEVWTRRAVAGRTDGRLGPEEVTDDIINNHKPYIYAPLLLLLLPPHCAGD